MKNEVCPFMPQCFKNMIKENETSRKVACIRITKLLSVDLLSDMLTSVLVLLGIFQMRLSELKSMHYTVYKP